VRRRLVVIAFLVLGDSLKVVVRGSDMARGGEMVLVARHLDLGVSHDFVPLGGLKAPIGFASIGAPIVCRLILLKCAPSSVAHDAGMSFVESAMPTLSLISNGRAGRCLVAGLALVAASFGTAAQGRLERDGVVLYLGLVPEAIVSQQHAISELHGGRPVGGGKINHLVVALFDAGSGRRVEDAVIRAQLSESGVVDGPPKYMPPMPVNGLGSYGQLFGMVGDGPYRFRIRVKLQDRQDEIEFNATASTQLTGR